ncbi:aminodeoxychorismate lyase [Colletotrichum melonis]|uniref:Aminodeoxychorismate lyase n=1 Tax=Colletotrichum melonis TaxID=1209925 RepID=A0AAI9UCG8_9PEZI|nr:aminodeoxychorismate lyase [Colletotrichum melonis]
MLSTHGETFKDPGRRFISYSAAWKRAGVDEATSPAECDVLLQNENGHIMGAAFRTVYFWRHGKLVTPSSETGCKMGVSRRWAVENVDSMKWPSNRNVGTFSFPQILHTCIATLVPNS